MPIAARAALAPACLSLACLGAASGAGAAIILKSSNPDLDSGFAWAVRQAWAWDVKDKPISPAYWAGIQDRPAVYARDFAHQALGAHLIGMDGHNRNLYPRFAASATAGRKWYVLWSLDFDGKPYDTDYRDDNWFVREAPTDFDLIDQAYRLYRWTGEDYLYRDTTLWSFYGHAIRDFVRLHDDWKPDGVVEGQGAGIFDGIATYTEDGQFLRESADAFATQYAAYRAYARFLDLRGLGDSAQAMDRQADDLYALFQKDWWDPDSAHYRRAYGNDGKWRNDYGIQIFAMIARARLCEPGARAASTVDYLKKNGGKDNFEAATYHPEAYYAYGERQAGFNGLLGFMKWRNTYPEVPFTCVSTTAQGLMGLQPEAAKAEVVTTHNLPDSGLAWATLDGVGVGAFTLTLTHKRQGGVETTVLRSSGPGELRWTARFYGSKALTLNGKARPGEAATVDGMAMTQTSVTLAPGQEATVEARTGPVSVARKLPDGLARKLGAAVAPIPLFRSGGVWRGADGRAR